MSFEDFFEDEIKGEFGDLGPGETAARAGGGGDRGDRGPRRNRRRR